MSHRYRPTAIDAAPPIVSAMATANMPLWRKSRPLNITTIISATKAGLAVGSGIGMPSSLAVCRSVSSCIGTAWLSVMTLLSACEWSMPAVIFGSLRSQSG